MRVIAVIPARWGSTRLPGKALRDLGGRPLLIRVLEAVRRCDRLDSVVVATDDERILDEVARSGLGEAVLTSKEHKSGTDRIAEVLRARDEDWVVNVQGDEPFLSADSLSALLDRSQQFPEEVGTLFERIDCEKDWLNPSIVKVTTDREDRALYFSRAPIPASHPGETPEKPWEQAKRHVGVYSCARETLLRWAGLAPTPLESREGLEQLRLMEHGVRFRLVESAGHSLGVDTVEQLDQARSRWAAENGKP